MSTSRCRATRPLTRNVDAKSNATARSAAIGSAAVVSASISQRTIQSHASPVVLSTVYVIAIVPPIAPIIHRTQGKKTKKPALRRQVAANNAHDDALLYCDFAAQRRRVVRRRRGMRVKNRFSFSATGEPTRARSRGRARPASRRSRGAFLHNALAGETRAQSFRRQATEP